MFRQLCLLILLFASSASAGWAQSVGGDPERGEMKSVICVACHGVGGVTQHPTFPKLAGQNASYLAAQLVNFQEGQRYHAIMSPIAESLTIEDINDLAAYYGAVGPLADYGTGGPWADSTDE